MNLVMMQPRGGSVHLFYLLTACGIPVAYEKGCEKEIVPKDAVLNIVAGSHHLWAGAAAPRRIWLQRDPIDSMRSMLANAVINPYRREAARDLMQAMYALRVPFEATMATQTTVYMANLWQHLHLLGVPKDHIVPVESYWYQDGWDRLADSLYYLGIEVSAQELEEKNESLPEDALNKGWTSRFMEPEHFPPGRYMDDLLGLAQAYGYRVTETDSAASASEPEVQSSEPAAEP